MDIKRLQTDMKNLGYYTGTADGIWGPLSESAYATWVDSVRSKSSPDPKTALAWGRKVSPVFKDRILWTANALRMPRKGVDWLMACIAFESGETFSPDIKNMAGSGATGLIQFMPKTAIGLGTTTERLARMDAEDQINYIYKYFKPFAGRLNTLGDVYMAILWPAGVGKDDDWKLWCKTGREVTYLQNQGLDVNNDGCITRGEAVSKVKAKLDKGMGPQFYG